MTVATEIEISIDEIEERLSALGLETEYHGDDDGTQFYIRVGDKEITIQDGVSGDYFRPEHVTGASYCFGIMGKDQTEQFADVESIEDFMYRVTDAMSIDFMAR